MYISSAADADKLALETHIWKFYSAHDSASFLNNGSQTHYFIKIIIFSMVTEKFFDFCQISHFDVLSQNPQYEPLFPLPLSKL